MPDIFGEDIAGQINKELGPLVFPVILTKSSAFRNTTDSTDQSVVTVDHAGKGFVADYEDRFVDGTIIQRGDKQVIILGASLPSGIIPKPNDKTTIESEVKVIINVERDPAGATYTCQVR